MPNFWCNKSKCQVCVESKYNKHTYKFVDKNFNSLELTYTDICDMKSTPYRCEKMCFINYIDNSIIYCYIYLLNRKDEAIEISGQYKTEVENHCYD